MTAAMTTEPDVRFSWGGWDLLNAGDQEWLSVPGEGDVDEPGQE